MTIPDYDTAGDSDTSPAAAPKAEGGEFILSRYTGEKTFTITYLLRPYARSNELFSPL